MTGGASPAPAIGPSVGNAPRLDLPGVEREPWLPRAGALAAAAMLHGLVLMLLLWPLLSSIAEPPVPRAIPVTLVPPPPAPPAPEPPRARRSGPEADGAGTSQAATTERQAEGAEPSASSAEQSAASPAPLPLPVRKPPRKVEPKPRAASPAAKPPSSAAAARVAGDRYLNAVRDRIERFRSYPPLARAQQLRGSALYAVAIDRAGRLLDITLLRSSGYDMLDREGARMIRAAAPLPSVPPDIPGERIEFAIGINLFPT